MPDRRDIARQLWESAFLIEQQVGILLAEAVRQDLRGSAQDCPLHSSKAEKLFARALEMEKCVLAARKCAQMHW